MSKPVIYIQEIFLKKNDHPLYFLFFKEIRNNFTVTSSFNNISPKVLNIFTNINEHIVKKIEENNIKNYIFILDGCESKKLNEKLLKYLSNALKIIIIDSSFENSEIFSNFVNVLFLSVNIKNVSIKKENNFFAFEEDLSFIFAEKLELIKEKKLYVLGNSNLSYWRSVFEKHNIYFVQLPSSLSAFDFCLEALNYLGKRNLQREGVDLIEFVEILNNIKKDILSDNRVENSGINIICFNPTYLFKDLVNRFEDKGCIHSEFPLPGFKSYIWMRPQEIWHLEYIKQNLGHSEISSKYYEAARPVVGTINMDDIKERSVVIHHGTCYEPLYQFDYNLLAKSLYDVKKVIGVCEFRECYGPSYKIANNDNFMFVPIGYDNNLFIPELINQNKRSNNNTLHLGFVGRAYGTSDFRLLAKSKLAEPKGYRKGGDILEAIITKLSIMNINFHLHILGQNWEYLVEYFESIGVTCTYYAREKNITYHDYPKIYAMLDALLITARCEGGPVSAIESLSLGVPIISTNVGVVQYLNETLQSGVLTFNYDKKWHIADINKAIEHIQMLIETPLTYKDKIKISHSVSKFTTLNWVEEIIYAATAEPIKSVSS